MGSTSVYLKGYANSSEAGRELGAYFRFAMTRGPIRRWATRPRRKCSTQADPPEGRIKGEEVCTGSSLGIIGRCGGTLT